MKKLLLPFLGFLLFLSSCQLDPCGYSKESFLDGYESLVEKASDKKEAYSKAEWEKMDERFRAYVEECYDQYEAEMTGKEKRKFWAKSLKYYSKRFGKGMKGKFKNDSDELSRKIKENTNKIIGNTSRELGKTLDKFFKDVENSVDDFSKDVEKDLEELGKKLEETFE